MHKGRWNTNIDLPVSWPRTTEVTHGQWRDTRCSRTMYLYRGGIPTKSCGWMSVLLSQGANAHPHSVYRWERWWSVESNRLPLAPAKANDEKRTNTVAQARLRIEY